MFIVMIQNCSLNGFGIASNHNSHFSEECCQSLKAYAENAIHFAKHTDYCAHSLNFGEMNYVLQRKAESIMELVFTSRKKISEEEDKYLKKYFRTTQNR